VLKVGAPDGSESSPGYSNQVASPSTWLYRRILELDDEEVSVVRRGFACDDDRIRDRLERLGRTVLAGHRTALECADEAEIPVALERVEPELRGFAYEGAAMGLALLDRLAPWKRGRWSRFLRGAGDRHAYMVHVGAGLASARLRRDVVAPKGADPLLACLVADGYGFHEGYFRWQEHSLRRPDARGRRCYAAQAYDQGLGRSAWFVCGASPPRIQAAIDAFPPARRADLWSGVGLACAYAGGLEPGSIEELRDLSGAHAPELAQGAAFASQARRRAGNPAPHTDLACRVLCGCSAENAADVAVGALEELAPEGELPAYAVWRQRIRSRFGAREVA